MKKVKKFLKKIEEKFNNLYTNKLSKVTFIQNLLFFLGITGILFICYNYNSNILILKNDTLKIIKTVSETLLILKISLTKEKLTTYLLFILYIILAFVCDNNIGMVSYGGHVSLIVISVLASRKIEIKRIIKYMLICNLIFISIHVVLYTFSEVFNISFFDSCNFKLIYRNNKPRHSFFFYHPNTFSNYLFWTYLMYVYLNFDKKEKRKKIIILALLGAILAWVFPNSRNACIFFLLSLVLLYLFNNKKIKNCFIFEFINRFVYSFIFLLSLLLILSFDKQSFFGDISRYINNIFNNRIYASFNYFYEYGVSLLGNYMTPVRNLIANKTTSIVFDNWYCYLFIRIGLIFTTISILHFFITGEKLFKKKNYAGLYVIFIFCLYSFVENVGITISTVFPLFLLAIV